MFGFFRRAFRPFASIGEKVSEIFNIGRKGVRSVEPVVEMRMPKSTLVMNDPLLQGAQFDPDSRGFFGSIGEQSGLMPMR
tara:strand:- start:632 stop:871 length:240 start_codon:yes stop_codon:yes gene_type:complete